MNYYFKVLQNYAIFSGRARRSEYWYFTLLNTVIAIAVPCIGGMVGNITLLSYIFVLYPVYSLAIIIPSIAVSVRRMHDVGKSGWFILIPIYSLILACTEGTKGENEYGADPKAE